MATISIGDWVKKTNRNLDQTTRGIKISLFNGVILDTRVDTGRMRGNWQTSTGGPIFSEVQRLDKSGSLATAEVESKVKSRDVDFLSNNVPYAFVWEERDGMVKRNMARITSILREEVAKAR
jgi:hypothetical protein